MAPNLYNPPSQDPMEGLVLSQKSTQFLQNLILFELEKRAEVRRGGGGDEPMLDDPVHFHGGEDYNTNGKGKEKEEDKEKEKEEDGGGGGYYEKNNDHEMDTAMRDHEGANEPVEANFA